MKPPFTAGRSDPRRAVLARPITPDRTRIHRRPKARPRQVEATPRPDAPPQAVGGGPRPARPAAVLAAAEVEAHRTEAVVVVARLPGVVEAEAERTSSSEPAPVQ